MITKNFEPEPRTPYSSNSTRQLDYYIPPPPPPPPYTSIEERPDTSTNINSSISAGSTYTQT